MNKIFSLLIEKAHALEIDVPIENPLNADSIQALIVDILEVVYQILTPIVALFIMYAGLLYVLARGNQEKLKKAHQALLYSLVGAAIVLGAFVLVQVLQGTIDSLSLTQSVSAQSRNEFSESLLPDSPKTIADACQNIQNFKNLVNCVTVSIVNPLIALLLGVALVYFLWGVLQYITKLNSKDQAEARQVMWWGIVALFVMVSVWGLVQVLLNTFGLDSTLPVPNIPSF